MTSQIYNANQRQKMIYLMLFVKVTCVLLTIILIKNK